MSARAPAGYNDDRLPAAISDSAFSMAKTDIRDQPAYTVAEAARYLKLAPATLRSWVAGCPYLTTMFHASTISIEECGR